MAFPAGVTTRQVSIGRAFALETGDERRISATIVSTNSLILQETGYRFDQTQVVSIPDLGSEAVIELPVTDQSGWRDATTGQLIDVSAPGSYTHRYMATVTTTNATGGELKSAVLGPFTVPTGAGVIDLDVALDAGTVAGAQDAAATVIAATQANADAAALSETNAAASEAAAASSASAAAASETNAAASAAAAEAVGSTNDEIIAEQINTAGSQTEQALKTTIDAAVAQVPVDGSIQDVLDAADGVTHHLVRLAPNTVYEISAPLSLTTDKVVLDLNGSTIRVADGANCNILNVGTSASPTDDIMIGNGRLDGNRDAQTSTDLEGIEFHRVTRFKLWNLAVDNVSGVGIFSIGNDVPTRWSQLVNVSADNNLSHGIWFGNAMRMVQYSNVEATGNGGYGVYLDHSEAQANGIYAHGNMLTGIYIRNVRACSYTNLTSNMNGEHGILVDRMVFSIGATWKAHNNGQSGSGFADVYFMDRSDGYGATHKSQVHGIIVGLNLGFAEAPITDYGVYVEDGLADRQVALTGIAYSAGTVVSNLRLPATSTGLVIQDYPEGTPNTRWERGNVLLNQPGAYVKLWATNTSGIPAAATAGAGAVVMNGQKKRLSLSSGTEWRDIALIDAQVQVAEDAAVSVGQTLTVAYRNTGSLTVTLPSPGLTLPGERYTVKNVGAISVTVATAGAGKTIDGATTVSLPPYAALVVVALNISGTLNWYIVGGNVSA